MRGLIPRNLYSESFATGSANNQINKSLKMIPGEIGGDPAYVGGILVSYYGTITGQAGTEDASQRALAASLGSVQLQGGGDHIASTALRGDELLFLQYLLNMGTCLCLAGDHGVIHDVTDVSTEGEAVEHHVVIPYSYKAFSAGRLGEGKPYDGARDAVLFGDSVNILLNQIGTAPVTDVAWSNITVKLTALMWAGQEAVAPMDVRIRPLGVINEDPKPLAFGQVADLVALGVLSDDIPTTDDSDPLALRTSAGIFEVELDGETILEERGVQIIPAINSQGMAGATLDARADEPSSTAILYSPACSAQSSHRPSGNKLNLKGWSAETEESRALAYTIAQPARDLLNKWASKRGYSLDKAQVSKTKPAAASTLDAKSGAGVGVDFVQPAKAR